MGDSLLYTGMYCLLFADCSLGVDVLSCDRATASPHHELIFFVSEKKRKSNHELLLASLIINFHNGLSFDDLDSSIPLILLAEGLP